MAYLIDETYFQRELFVPNADDQDRGAYKELQEFIDEKSRLCLKEALGYVLFKELDSYIDDGNLEGSAPSIWGNLVNGVEYTVNGNTYKWEGLISTEGAFKRSLLANYTYYYWLYYNQSTMSGVGEVVLNAKNAINVNSTQRLVSTWNTFLQMYQGNKTQSGYNKYYHKGIKVIDYIGGGTDDNYVHLIKFLSDNNEYYPNAALKLHKPKNQLGL